MCECTCNADVNARAMWMACERTCNVDVNGAKLTHRMIGQSSCRSTGSHDMRPSIHTMIRPGGRHRSLLRSLPGSGQGSGVRIQGPCGPGARPGPFRLPFEELAYVGPGQGSGVRGQGPGARGAPQLPSEEIAHGTGPRAKGGGEEW